MKFSEIREDSTTLASRTIRNYARELGPDSMDYGMFMKSAELLDKGMLKSLAQLIDKSDTAPREYVMKKIADHDPETFKKLYGDQEGYLSVMKPVQDLKDAEDNTDRGMNKYGLAARQKDGKFYSYRHGKLTGTFDNIQDLQKHQQELIQKESAVQEDAPFDGMGLVRMALMRKFITAQEWHGLQHKWKDAVEELEQRYDDWPEDQGFGSSDHAYAIKELMELVGYEFDDQDTSGRFVVSKMPPELEKAGIKNARMRDAQTTEDMIPNNMPGNIGDYAHEKSTGRLVRIVDYTDDDEGIYTISYGEDQGETDVTAGDLEFVDPTVNQDLDDKILDKEIEEAPIEQDRDNPIAKPYVDTPEWKALHDMDDKIIQAYIKHKEVAEADGLQSADLKRLGQNKPKVYVHKDGKTIMVPKDQANNYIAKGWKKSALRAETSYESKLADMLNQRLK